MLFRAAAWMRARFKPQRPLPRVDALPRQRLPMCLNCLHFRNDPADIEAALPGLVTFGAGRANPRVEDGLCVCHDRFVTTQSSCAKFRDRLAKARPDGQRFGS